MGYGDVKDNLITYGTAAAILNVSWQRVQQLAAEGKLREVANGSLQRRTLFRRADVERLRVERGVGRYGRTYTKVSLGKSRTVGTMP